MCSRSSPADMSLPELLAVLLVIAVCGLLLAGYPVALTLGGVSLAFAAIGHLLGAMSFSFIGALPQRVFGVMTNEVLLAIPLFVFMGVMLERSRVAEELFETMGRSFGSLRGGLGLSVIIVGTLLAAAKGVVGATTVTTFTNRPCAWSIAFASDAYFWPGMPLMCIHQQAGKVSTLALRRLQSRLETRPRSTRWPRFATGHLRIRAPPHRRRRTWLEQTPLSKAFQQARPRHQPVSRALPNQLSLFRRPHRKPASR